MTKHLKIQFVIADGARARWVRRSENADDFVTSKETKAEPRATGHPEGVVFEGTMGRRFTVEESQGAARQHREAFAREVADTINAEAAEGAFERLAIVAPARTLSAITHHLTKIASALLVKTLAKDLSKTPDHEIGAWLRPLELV
jgi:protein required for attachment to host cells